MARGKLKLYEVPRKGRFWYDPADPFLPKDAKLLEEPEPEAEVKPKPKKKAAKPKNKAVTPDNKAVEPETK